VNVGLITKYAERRLNTSQYTVTSWLTRST